MRFQAGARLGPYEIIGPIGAGGMGEVYRARDSRLGREVAIKVLPQELAGDRERLARFEREARSSSALNHRNIVTIHDFSTGDDEAWLVMELIQGESLRNLLSHGPVSMKKLLSISSGMAHGLAAAHAAGIVHRDLKPENIMISADGTPKILDFGLVKQSAPNHSLEDATDLKVSMAGAVMGTAGYMSPEQGSGADVDFRSDQFSFGVILHEMASGRHPFQRATGIQMIAAIINDDPEPLAQTLPQPFVWIVERCLEKSPAERYGSTFDLAHDLARLKEGSDRYLHPDIARSKPKWATVAAVLASLISLLSVVLVTTRQEEKTTGDPVYASISTPDMAEVHRGEVALSVALSPNGRYLVVYGSDINGTNRLMLHDLRNGERRLLAENAFAACWSPDSNLVAYFKDGKLMTIPAEGGPSRTVCDARPEGTASWHGDTILFPQYSKDPGIYRVNAGGGTPQLLKAPGSKPRPWWPQFLPDGKRFLYLTLRSGSAKTDIEHELRVGSLDESPTRPVARMRSRAVYADGQLLFVNEGTLMSQPFDPDEARTTGEARPLVDRLHYFRSTGAAAFTVSESGLLAWRSSRSPVRLVWMDRAGMELAQVGSAPFDTEGRISSDDKRYAVSVVDQKHGSGDLWVWELDRDSPQRLTFRLFDERSPVWAPNGRTIYYRSDGGGGPPDIMRLEPGAAAGAAVYRGPAVEEPQDISRDGKWLLFLDYSFTGSDISLLPLDPPGRPRPFVATPFNEWSPRFSPDSKWVAYVSNISGRPEIYVRPFDGSSQDTRVSTNGGTRPRWRKDGSELFYLTSGGRVMVASLSNGRWGAPRILFQAANAVDFDVALGGSRFLVQLDEHRGEPEVHLLMNWPARLKVKD